MKGTWLSAEHVTADVRQNGMGWYWVRTYPQSRYGVVVRVWLDSDGQMRMSSGPYDFATFAAFVRWATNPVFSPRLVDPFRRRPRPRESEERRGGREET